MAQEPSRREQLDQLTGEQFGDPPKKMAALRLAFEGVSDHSLAQVVEALDEAVPARAWSPQHTFDPSKVAEENVEAGRYLLVHQLHRLIDERKMKQTDDDSDE